MHLREREKHLKISASALICLGHAQRRGTAVTAASCFASVLISDFFLIPVSSDLGMWNPLQAALLQGQGLRVSHCDAESDKGIPQMKGPHEDEWSVVGLPCQAQGAEPASHRVKLPRAVCPLSFLHNKALYKCLEEIQEHPTEETTDLPKGSRNLSCLFVSRC